MYSLLKYGVMYIQWYLVAILNKKLFNYQTVIWQSNNINFLNATTISFLIIYEKYNNITPSAVSIYYYSAVAFYIFDILNKDISKLFLIHHIMTVFMILLMQFQTSINKLDIARNILLVFELGNLPIYLVYGMKTSVYKLYWQKSLFLKISLVFEFIWFLIFRCILPCLILPQLENIHKLCLSIFILMSIKWLIGMYHSIIKHFKQFPLYRISEKIDISLQNQRF